MLHIQVALRISRRPFPSILQCNVNGLRPRLPELCLRLGEIEVDVLALKETHMSHGEFRLLKCVQFHCMYSLYGLKELMFL